MVLLWELARDFAALADYIRAPKKLESTCKHAEMLMRNLMKKGSVSG